MNRDTLSSMNGWQLRGLIAACIVVAACGEGAGKRQKRESGGDVDLARSATSTSRMAADSLARAADSLVRAGRPWRATVLLTPVLRTIEQATPEQRLAGARAAAAWEGWQEVQRLLRGQPWIDKEFGGEGRELIVRSMLELDASAAVDARLALSDATDDASRVVREVLLARAHDRGNARDSAAAHYLAASTKLPRIGDWLRLRAAGVTADAASRAELFTRLTLPAAKARVFATEAQARERTGDLGGAIVAFRRAGDEPSALRIEALGARDPSVRDGLAKRIIAFLERTQSASEARQALEILDRLTGVEIDQLALAHVLATTVPVRAVAAFARAAAVQPLSSQYRMEQAAALGRAGRAGEAARVYATITDSSLAPIAAYQRARMLVQANDGVGARAALKSVAAQYPTVQAAAAPALLLLADLQVDDNDQRAALQSLRELYSRHPDAPQAPLARFRAALLTWSDAGVAASAFDSLAAKYPGDEEAAPARYWAARALERAGRAADAKLRLHEIIKTSPLGYYAMRAAARLGESGWTPPSTADSIGRHLAIDSASQRVMTLRRLGMDVEVRFEMDALAERADKNPAEAAAAAQALSSNGEPARALRVALAALDKGQTALSLYRLAFPIVHQDALMEETKRNNLDPALVAGLIRQESSWNPRAVSVASARGLMQVMPSVGASLATRKQYPFWNSVLLFQPDVSLELGTQHLASSIRKDVPVERSLAAYNAGASRVTRWSTRPGVEDAELFTEWIPFTETRDYVRIVLRNAAIYRALYGLK